MADPTFTKTKLSASVDGRMIKVGATASPGTLLHTVNPIAGDNNFDEVWLWVVNSDTTARKLTVEWGGTTSPDDTIELTIQPEAGLVLVVPGWVLQNALLVRAFAATANVLLIGGYVNAVRS